MKSTEQIAARLVELCRQGDFETAQKELYSKDAISIEPEASGGFDKETKGLEAILEKGKKFDGMIDTTHKVEISEPVIAAHSFAFGLQMDITMKGKDRTTMNELCVYKVKDGKIVAEEFFM